MDPYSIITNGGTSHLERVRAIRALRQAGATYTEILDGIEARSIGRGADGDFTVDDAYKIFDQLLVYLAIAFYALIAAGYMAAGFAAGYLWTALVVKALNAGQFNVQYVLHPDAQVWRSAVVSMLLWAAYGYLISDLSPFSERARKRIKIWAWPVWGVFYLVQRLS